jgi:hypothetical protein
VTSGEDTASYGRVLAIFVADGGVAMATEECGVTAVGEDARQVMDVDLSELQRRAGALARELGRQYGFDGHEWRTHWADMTQTALLAFLENSEQPLAYAYACARTALKNYGWIHVRGLNGGWKSLVARDYSLVDIADNTDSNDESSDDNLAWRLRQARPWDMVPRPVEWAVVSREDGPPPEAADLFRDLLITLVGMSSERWYPERMDEKWPEQQAKVRLFLRQCGGCVEDGTGIGLSCARQPAHSSKALSIGSMPARVLFLFHRLGVSGPGRRPLPLCLV